MFTHRALLLIVIVPLTNHALADILVQPGYQYRYHYNPYNAPYHQVPRYHASYLGQYPMHAPYPFYQPVYPQMTPSFMDMPSKYPYYGIHGAQAQAQAQAEAQSAILGQLTPSHGVTIPSHTSNPSPPKHSHVTRIGDNKYAEPSVYMGSSYTPMIAHYRYRRSADPANVGPSSESTTYEHDVAPKSSLINQKYPTAIDSALTESESTTDKHVETRQSTDNHGRGSFLLSLYPANSYSEHGQIEEKIRHSQPKYTSINKPMETEEIMNRQKMENLDYRDLHKDVMLTAIQGNDKSNALFRDSQTSSNPILIPSRELSDQELTLSTNYKNYNDEYDVSIVPMISSELDTPTTLQATPSSYAIYGSTWFFDPRLSYSKPVFSRHRNVQASDKQHSSQQSDSEHIRDTWSETDKLDIINYENINKAYMMSTHYNPASSEMPAYLAYFYQDYPYRIIQSYPYLINPNLEAQQNTERNLPFRSSDLPQTQRSANVYNYPIRTGYVAVPPTYKHYYSSSMSNYASLPQINDHLTPIVNGYNRAFLRPLYYR